MKKLDMIILSSKVKFQDNTFYSEHKLFKNPIIIISRFFSLKIKILFLENYVLARSQNHISVMLIRCHLYKSSLIGIRF
jgi:hypothetical protein